MNREEAMRLLARWALPQIRGEARSNRILDFWGHRHEPEDEDDRAFLTLLPSELAKELTTSAGATDPDLPRYDFLVEMSLMSDLRAVSNSFLARELLDRLGMIEEVEGELGGLECCECCGFRTLRPPVEWSICRACGWENCAVGLDAPSGANGGMSLLQARLEFREQDPAWWTRPPSWPFTVRSSTEMFERGELPQRT